MAQKYFYIHLLFLCIAAGSNAQKADHAVVITPVGNGWANNSVNTVVFRKNSLVSFRDTQFIAYYNADKKLVLGKRSINSSTWQLVTTPFSGNISDAHNSISIMVDGDGYLHLAWDHHNNPLRYAKSVAPGSLQLTEKMPMTGLNETKLTYPEFYKLPNGNLLFFYRNGASGNGNLVINRYDTKTKAWTQLQQNLIDGEGKRNAYWQAGVDAMGHIHLSWVWRESPDVASNHDLCYARSDDEGKTWQTSGGKKYDLPITANTAEYIATIPQRSELINQTAMTADETGAPFIATWYKEAGDSIPQYHVAYRHNNQWKILNAGFNTRPFSLSGAGTKRIPISRPQVLVWKNKVVVIFRDEARGSKVSAAVCNNIVNNKWKLFDLTEAAVGSWEPSFDTELWRTKRVLHLFVQKTAQADGEGTTAMPPQPVMVLQWKPF